MLVQLCSATTLGSVPIHEEPVEGEHGYRYDVVERGICHEGPSSAPDAAATVHVCNAAVWQLKLETLHNLSGMSHTLLHAPLQEHATLISCLA